MWDGQELNSLYSKYYSPRVVYRYVIYLTRGLKGFSLVVYATVIT